MINGHKWFTSNGKRADFFIVMCRTEDAEGGADASGRMTQIIVPRDTPGVNIVRGITVWGVESDHCEIIYDDVRVPLDNQLGSRGERPPGRAGPARRRPRLPLHELDRADVACVRPHGRARDESARSTAGCWRRKQFIQGFIADSYMDIQAARLMTIHCAEKMATDIDPRTDISAIKVFVPAAYERVVDRAIQVWGAAGVSGDLPLAAMYQGARTLRLADGPDEVHRILIAKNVLAQYHRGAGWDFGN